jgi:hypothetical protein
LPIKIKNIFSVQKFPVLFISVFSKTGKTSSSSQFQSQIPSEQREIFNLYLREEMLHNYLLLSTEEKELELRNANQSEERLILSDQPLVGH